MNAKANERYYEALDEAAQEAHEILSNALREAFLALHNVAGAKESDTAIMQMVVAAVPECVSLAMHGLQNDNDGFFDCVGQFSDDAAGFEQRVIKTHAAAQELTAAALTKFMARRT